VQFSAEEEAFVRAVDRATTVDVGGLTLRLAGAPDLVLMKLAAAEEPHRRASKRDYDIADIQALLEERPDLKFSVPDLEERLRRIRSRVLNLGR
jgi:hypothetical protein